MIVAAVTTLCALIGLIFLLQARRRFRRRRLGSCALHGLSSLVFFLAAACAALLVCDPHRIRIASPSAGRRVDAAPALSQLSAMGRYALWQRRLHADGRRRAL